MSISKQKQSLRKEMRERLRSSHTDSRQIQRKIAHYLETHPEYHCIAAFAPLQGEVDLLPLLQETNRNWVFPKISAEAIDFYRVKNPTLDLTPGAYAILEPAPHCHKVPISQIDLILCPGIAFSRDGARLGRGKGYYDRTLCQVRKDASIVGVCFDFQITENIPMDQHDILMNRVFTEVY
jgi:5-formyltetrahydrofolate cyclo-ligase